MPLFTDRRSSHQNRFTTRSRMGLPLSTAMMLWITADRKNPGPAPAKKVTSKTRRPLYDADGCDPAGRALPKRTALFCTFDREGDMQPATRQELKQLVEIYALHTRRLSEAIAVLGAHVTAQRQIDE